MTTEINNCEKLCAQRTCRRGFLKLIVTVGLFAGCGVKQKSTVAAIPKYSAEDFKRMSYCGIRCQEDCPGLYYPGQCGGCKSNGTIKIPAHTVCEIRKCAMKKNVLTCAHCDKFTKCRNSWYKRYPQLKSRIRGIWKDLQNIQG